MTTEVGTKEQWTYLGAVALGDDFKLAYSWRDGDGVTRTFTKKNLDRFARAGAIYAVHVTRDGEGGTTVITGGKDRPVFVAMLEDQEELARIQANHRTGETLARVHKQAKADMSRDALKEMLDPIRAEYRRRATVGRRALLAVVIEAITA